MKIYLNLFRLSFQLGHLLHPLFKGLLTRDPANRFNVNEARICSTFEDCDWMAIEKKLAPSPIFFASPKIVPDADAVDNSVDFSYKSKSQNDIEGNEGQIGTIMIQLNDNELTNQPQYASITYDTQHMEIDNQELLVMSQTPGNMESVQKESINDLIKSFKDQIAEESGGFRCLFSACNGLTYFKSKKSAYQHAVDHANTINETFKCILCAMVFSRQKRLDMHFIEHLKPLEPIEEVSM